MTGERRPIQKRGGYQPTAHGPAPTEPPPKPPGVTGETPNPLDLIREFVRGSIRLGDGDTAVYFGKIENALDQVETLVEATQAVERIYEGLRTDESDGEFALWSEDQLVAALHALRPALVPFATHNNT